MTEKDKLYADELRNKALADYERLDHAINELERLTCDTPRNNLAESSQDCISREEAINCLTALCKSNRISVGETIALEKVIKELEQTRWIPIKTRPLTEEEKEELGHEYAFMYDCPLPDDGQDVLVTDYLGNVEVDTFCRDYEGFYFETNCDDGEVIAWMPLSQPYKEESEG